ncbi:MAG: fibrinogen-like YCDxxxxGGGW domain-containing protein, partial [Cyanobacteria bacterium J06560_2]
MSDGNDGGKKSFWATLPGVLTGFAALITSVTALIATVRTINFPSKKPEEPKVYSSCKDVLKEDASASTGVYTIDRDGEGGADSFDVKCDMETDEGGWTLLAKSNLISPISWGLELSEQTWVDIFQNFAVVEGETVAEIRKNRAFSYSELETGQKVFFANIQALGTLPFSEVLMYDGKQTLD